MKSEIQKKKRYTFRQQHDTGFIQRRLEKQHALLNQVQTLLCGEKEVTGKHRIN